MCVSHLFFLLKKVTDTLSRTHEKSLFWRKKEMLSGQFLEMLPYLFLSFIFFSYKRFHEMTKLHHEMGHLKFSIMSPQCNVQGVLLMTGQLQVYERLWVIFVWPIRHFGKIFLCDYVDKYTVLVKLTYIFRNLDFHQSVAVWYMRHICVNK